MFPVSLGFGQAWMSVVRSSTIDCKNTEIAYAWFQVGQNIQVVPNFKERKHLIRKLHPGAVIGSWTWPRTIMAWVRAPVFLNFSPVFPHWIRQKASRWDLVGKMQQSFRILFICTWVNRDFQLRKVKAIL